MYINQPHSDPFAPRQPIGDIQLGGKDEPDIPNIAYYTTPSDYENKGRPLICSMNLRSLLKRATTDGILDPLIKIQKKALRIVANAKWISHCEPLWKKVGALKFSDLHKLACTKKAYKIINGIAPAGITPIFKPKCVRSRRLEHFAQLKVPFARIAQTQNLPSYQIPYLWNSLPSNISMTSINSFSDSFKKYKLTHYGGFICTTPNCYSCANS